LTQRVATNGSIVLPPTIPVMGQQPIKLGGGAQNSVQVIGQQPIRLGGNTAPWNPQQVSAQQPFIIGDNSSWNQADAEALTSSSNKQTTAPVDDEPWPEW